jgi:hypothetical protein
LFSNISPRIIIYVIRDNGAVIFLLVMDH